MTHQGTAAATAAAAGAHVAAAAAPVDAAAALMSAGAGAGAATAAAGLHPAGRTGAAAGAGHQHAGTAPHPGVLMGSACAEFELGCGSSGVGLRWTGRTFQLVFAAAGMSADLFSACPLFCCVPWQLQQQNASLL
jgi:hypothetical protein